MNQVFRSKLLRPIILFGLIIKTTFGSINLNSKMSSSQIISISHPINPIDNSDRLFALSKISFRLKPLLTDYEYNPNIGFGYKISKNLALEGSIFNKLLDDSSYQVISGGIQYFFGRTDTLSWVSSIKKSSYNSMKIYSFNSITFDVSKWINFKSKFFRLGFGSTFYTKSDYINNLTGQINFAFMNILIPIKVFHLGFGLEINQNSSLNSLFIQKDFH